MQGLGKTYPFQAIRISSLTWSKTDLLFVPVTDATVSSAVKKQLLHLFYSPFSPVLNFSYLFLIQHFTPVSLLASPWLLILLFCSPRGRLQLAFHTSAEMASKSIYLVIQTKTVILQEQAGSQARKSMDKVADPQQRPSIICQTPFPFKTCVQNQE